MQDDVGCLMCEDRGARTRNRSPQVCSGPHEYQRDITHAQSSPESTNLKKSGTNIV